MEILTDGTAALNLIYQDSKYSGISHIWIRNQNKQLHSLAPVKSDDINRFCSELTFNKTNDYYITANTTTRNNRISKELFALQNIVIDIDCHSEKIDSYDREVCLDVIANAINNSNIIPTPNIIHWTGRGLQLWYHIESAAASLLFVYRQCVTALAETISCELKKLQNNDSIYNSFSVDNVSSNNPVGLYRLFGSYNTNTGHRTCYSITQSQSYTLNGLLQLLPEPASEQGQGHAIVRNYKTKSNVKYISLQHKRIEILKWIILKRNASIGEEQRDIICFLAYNAAVQYMTKSMAQQLVKSINNMFKQPLDDLNYIFKYIDQKGCLQFKNNTWYKWIGMSEAEINDFNLQHTSKSNYMRDQLRLIKRNQRNAQIMKLHNTGYTYTYIANSLQLCRQTVSHVVHAILRNDIIQEMGQALILARKNRNNNNDIELMHTASVVSESINMPNSTYTETEPIALFISST